MNKTLMAIIAALCAGCSGAPRTQDASKEPQKNAYTHQQVIDLEKRHQEIYKDNKVSRSEISELIQLYDKTRNAVLAEGVGDHVKDDLENIKKLYKQSVNDIFDQLDLYSILVGVDDASMGFKDVPANFGAVKPLYLGTGVQHKNTFTFEQKEEIVRKARNAWKAYDVTKGDVRAGGGRIQGLEATALEVNKDKVTALIGGGIKARAEGYREMSKDEWTKQWGDGKDENGEMKRYFVSAVLPDSGYDVPK